MGAVAWGLWPSPRFPSPLIKPDVPISGIRLSDWLHRRLTPARLLAPVVGPPTSHTPVPRGTGGCLAKTPCAAFSRNSAHDHTRTHRLPYTPGLCSRSGSTAASLATSDSASDRPPPTVLRSAAPAVRPLSA